MAGLQSDPWQEFVVHNALGERPDGKWAAFEVGIELPRQNGKGGILEILELAGLFLLGERLIVHSAHEFATAEEALERMASIIEGCPDLSRRVKAIKRSHGQEGIYLRNGQRLRYRTRTKGGGRGFTADRVILDEAMEIPVAFRGALMPTLSAIANPQLVYAGSAVDRLVMDHGEVFASVRARALRGDDPSLAYFGWGAAFESPDRVTPQAAADPETWAAANPALGIRITSEHVAKEQRSMDPRTFAVERLGVGDWPVLDGDAQERPIPTEAWADCEDGRSRALDPVCLAFDVTPDRSRAAVGVAGRRADGRFHVEVIEHRAGTGWVTDRLAQLTGDHDVMGVVCDASGPAGSLVAEIEEREITVQTVSTKDLAQACGLIFDLVDQRALRHLGTSDLTAAVSGAARRQVADAWAWSRRGSSSDVSPLVAVTLAVWGARGLKPSTKRKFNLDDFRVTSL